MKISSELCQYNLSFHCPLENNPTRNINLGVKATAYFATTGFLLAEPCTLVGLMDKI